MTPKYAPEDIKPYPYSDKVGLPLLREMIEMVEAEYERDEDNQGGAGAGVWDQTSWFNLHLHTIEPLVLDYITTHETLPWNCGTTGCLAGNIALAKGARLLIKDVESLKDGSTSVEPHWIRTPTGATLLVADWAAGLVGLTEDQVEILFAGGRTVSELMDCLLALELAERTGTRADLNTVIYGEDPNRCPECGTGWDDEEGAAGCCYVCNCGDPDCRVSFADDDDT